MLAANVRNTTAYADLLFADAIVLSEQLRGEAYELFRQCADIRRKTLGVHFDTGRAIYRQAVHRRGPRLDIESATTALVEESLYIFRQEAQASNDQDVSFDFVAETADVLQTMSGLLRRHDESKSDALREESRRAYCRAGQILGTAVDRIFIEVAVRRELRRRDLEKAIATIGEHYGEFSDQVATACIARGTLDCYPNCDPDRPSQLRAAISAFERALQIKKARFGKRAKQVAELKGVIAEAAAELNLIAK